LEVRLGKDAMGFDAEWIAYRAYRFQLIFSGPEPEQDPVASNVVTMNVTPAPAGGPTPFTLTLSGPETVTTGGAVRVDLAEKNTSNLGSLGPQDQLNLLECHFSVRDLSGHELPMNSQTDGITGSHHLKALESGWTSNGYAILSDFYDMSQPGTYRVQVSERSPGYPEAGPVFSNVITIQVRAAAR
jgi:hypothetical protein